MVFTPHVSECLLKIRNINKVRKIQFQGNLKCCYHQIQKLDDQCILKSWKYLVYPNFRQNLQEMRNGGKSPQKIPFILL